MKAINCAVYLACTGFFFFIAGRFVPRNILSYDTWLFRERPFEKRLYRNLKVSKWQDKIPDMSRIFKSMMPAKRLNGIPGNEQLLIMVKESCIAEYTHLVLCCTGLVCLYLWRGIFGIILTVLYILLGNVPFIIVQRYNRPRLIKLMQAKRLHDIKRRDSIEDHKTLILTCNTGQGHNSCANAIREEYIANHQSCDIMDGLLFISTGFSRLISRGHAFIYRHIPRVFGFSYHMTEEHPSLYAHGSAKDRINSNAAEHLYAFLLDHSYDTVICTHIFAALLLTRKCSEIEQLKIKTAFVATDQTCYPMVELSRVERYFVADAMHIDSYTAKGIPSEKIIVSGIPVRRDFYLKTDRTSARTGYHIPGDARHLLVMGGSMGCKAVMRVVDLLMFRLKKDQYITIVCGNNKHLTRKLKRRYVLNKRVRILGYVSDISTLMDSADVYLTKPGGLSTTEAAVKNLPMVLMNTVAGCEKYNLEFYTGRGIAVTAKHAPGLAALCRDLLDSPEKTARMRTSGSELIRENSSAIIRNTMNQFDWNTIV